MPSGVYGAPAGAQMAQLDLERQASSNLNLATGRVKLKQAQIALENQERMMKYLSQSASGQAGASGGQDPTTGMADEFYQLSNYAARSGLVKEASDYAKVGSTLQRNSAYIKNQHLTRQMKEMTLFANLLDGVNDQASWQRANAAFMLETGQRTKWANMPYNPRVVQALKDGVLSQKDKMSIMSSRAKIQYDQSMDTYHDQELALRKQSNEIAEQRNKFREKNGGKSKAPAAQALQAVSDLIVSDYGKGAGQENIRIYARPIAERATEILKKNPTLTLSEAASQAYQEAKADGELGGMAPNTHNLGTHQNPLPMPKDAAELQDNMYYKGANGQIGVWSAKDGKFVVQ